MTKDNPKERIMKERGLVSTQTAPNKSRRFTPRILPDYSVPKTTLMKYLENKYGIRIEEVLVSGSLSMVAKKLGDEVDVTTISKWIKKFKLRYTATNLPNCTTCRQYGPACEGGICLVLIKLELYELIPTMKEKLFGGGIKCPR